MARGASGIGRSAAVEAEPEQLKPGDNAAGELEFALVVDAELFRLDAVIGWLDAAEGRIKRAAFDSPTSATLGLPKLPKKTLLTSVTCAEPERPALTASGALENCQVFDARTKSTLGARPLGSDWLS